LTADQQALAERWRFLAVKVAHKVWYGQRRRPNCTLDDLVQAGCLGVLYAARCYRAGHAAGARFATYAYKAALSWVLKELAQGVIHVPEATARRVRKARAGKTQPDAEVCSAERAYACELIGGGEEDFEAPPEDPFAHEDLARALGKLRGADRDFLLERFGLDGRGGATLDHFAARLGITREGVRRRQQRILGELRRHLEAA